MRLAEYEIYARNTPVLASKPCCHVTHPIILNNHNGTGPSSSLRNLIELFSSIEELIIQGLSPIIVLTVYWCFKKFYYSVKRRLSENLLLLKSGSWVQPQLPRWTTNILIKKRYYFRICFVDIQHVNGFHIE